MKLSAVLLACGLAGVFTTSAGAQLGDPTHETTTSDVPGLTAATSLCKIADDVSFGTKENPIKTGGGDLYMASRQVKYLSALRGPAGEGIHFKRAGSVRSSDGNTILDLYNLDYKGVRLSLYIDGYHWADPVAPPSLLCGAPFNLAPPGPDAFETTKQRLTIAISLGAAEVAPISLDADGSNTHGVVYDHARLVALAARAAAAAGKPLEADKLPRDVGQARMVVIAAPLACGAEKIPADSVKLTDARGTEPPSTIRVAGAKIADLAPGLPAADDAIAVAYAVPGPIAGARTTVHYARPCNGLQDVTLPFTFTPPHVVKEAPAPAPPGKTVPADGARVVLQLFVASDGSALYPAFVSGPLEFTDAAIESLKGWRFEPSRVNGAPLYQPEKVMVVVK